MIFTGVSAFNQAWEKRDEKFSLLIAFPVENCGKHQNNGVSEVQRLCSPVAESLEWCVGANRQNRIIFSTLTHSTCTIRPIVGTVTI